MPNEKRNTSGDGRDFKDGIFRNFSLLALPWVSFQQDMLGILKKGIKDTSHVKPVQKLTFLELHALMMILDPSRTWRGLFDGDFEQRVEDAYKKHFPKLLSGSVGLIEAQEKILQHISEALVTLKDGNKTKSHGKRKSS